MNSELTIIEYLVLRLISEISDVENLLLLSDSTERGHVVKSVITKRGLYSSISKLQSISRFCIQH